jgi:hypothetical protein
MTDINSPWQEPSEYVPTHLFIWEWKQIWFLKYCIVFNTIWWTNPRNKVILRIKVFGYVTLCCWCFLFFWKNAMPASLKVDGSNPWRQRHYIIFLCNVRKYQFSNTVSYPRRSQCSRKLLWKTPVSHSTPCITQTSRTEFNFLFHRNLSTLL